MVVGMLDFGPGCCSGQANCLVHGWKHLKTGKLEILGLCSESIIANSKTNTDLPQRQSSYRRHGKTTWLRMERLLDLGIFTFFPNFYSFLHFIQSTFFSPFQDFTVILTRSDHSIEKWSHAFMLGEKKKGGYHWLPVTPLSFRHLTWCWIGN